MTFKKYVRIPMNIVLDNNITVNSKLLYGLLVMLSHKEGYCYANNDYLSNKLKVGNRSITRLLKELSDNNYIVLEYKHKFIRKIYINTQDNTSINLDEIF